jgi:hypothetical protein
VHGYKAISFDGSITDLGLVSDARAAFHAALIKGVLRVSGGVPSNADGNNQRSVQVATGIAKRVGSVTADTRLAGQVSGNRFEEICESFLSATFTKLSHLRPGSWHISRASVPGRRGISRFEQYRHLTDLEEAAHANPALAAAIGTDYMIRPDVMIFRDPEQDKMINATDRVVDATSARMSSLRAANQSDPLLHASVSCKWTIRSDRAQNARSEGLNLIRNRKGRVPHIVVITGEPLPSRIASLALGTGDIDCVYHFALPELADTLGELGLDDAAELLLIMTAGRRLKDISDLPLDLAV